MSVCYNKKREMNCKEIFFVETLQENGKKCRSDVVTNSVLKKKRKLTSEDGRVSRKGGKKPDKKMILSLTVNN